MKAIKICCLVLFMAILMSCEKTEQILMEDLFIYNAISNTKIEIDHKLQNAKYIEKQKEAFYFQNDNTGIIADVYYNELNLSESIVYIIPEINYYSLISELNLNLIIEVSDSIWYEEIDNNINIWRLVKGLEIHDDIYLLLVELKKLNNGH